MPLSKTTALVALTWPSSGRSQATLALSRGPSPNSSGMMAVVAASPRPSESTVQGARATLERTAPMPWAT